MGFSEGQKEQEQQFSAKRSEEESVSRDRAGSNSGSALPRVGTFRAERRQAIDMGQEDGYARLESTEFDKKSGCLPCCGIQ